MFNFLLYGGHIVAGLLTGAVILVQIFAFRGPTLATFFGSLVVGFVVVGYVVVRGLMR